MTYYVAIEGVIGVGKTTLARYLQEALHTSLLIEVFEENPFLANFYSDRARYAFQTQVFFLLSRYHQQRRLRDLPRPLVSDYIFAKDRLFARHNLSDDELTTYEQVYEALAEHLPMPDLVVYLRADTPVLMSRIAIRDRPYERGMDVDYIDSLRLAYDRFFASYSTAPVLAIDTNQFDIVRHEQDRLAVINQIRGALGVGPRQSVLPGLDEFVAKPLSLPPEEIMPEQNPAAELHRSTRRLGDFQRFHLEFDRVKGFSDDLFLNFVLLQEEIGELATEVLNRWRRDQEDLPVDNLDKLRSELADVLAYIIKIANYTGVDLEQAYLEKMSLNQRRRWRHSLPDISRD